jgi:hypothetical protein
MSRIILLGGIIAAVLLSAGATTIAVEITKLTGAYQRPVPAAPAILKTHLQEFGGEIALP